MTEKNILLVWETVPETTDIYLLEVTEEELTFLSEADNKYINAGDTNTAMATLFMSLCEETLPTDDKEIPKDNKEYMDMFGVGHEWYGRFYHNKFDALPSLEGLNIHTIIRSGFCL